MSSTETGIITPEQERIGQVVEYLLGGFQGAAEDIPGLTRWELCTAMANTQAILLANAKGMPEMEAFRRFEELRDIMREAFEQQRRRKAPTDDLAAINGEVPSSG